jgi:hypothetical protein
MLHGDSARGQALPGVHLGAGVVGKVQKEKVRGFHHRGLFRTKGELES